MLYATVATDVICNCICNCSYLIVSEYALTAYLLMLCATVYATVATDVICNCICNCSYLIVSEYASTAYLLMLYATVATANLPAILPAKQIH